MTYNKEKSDMKHEYNGSAINKTSYEKIYNENKIWFIFKWSNSPKNDNMKHIMSFTRIPLIFGVNWLKIILGSVLQNNLESKITKENGIFMQKCNFSIFDCYNNFNAQNENKVKIIQHTDL